MRNLLVLDDGGMAHFELAPGAVAVAEGHHTVEEIWYFLIQEYLDGRTATGIL